MFPANRPRLRRQTGMTLVEMIAALMVGMLLATVLGELLFSNNTIAARQQDSLQQEIMLYRVAETIGRSVRNAAYLGCAGTASRPYPERLERPLHGHTISNKPLIQGALVDSQLLQLSGMEVLDTPSAAKDGEAIFISDCSGLTETRTGQTARGPRLQSGKQHKTSSSDTQLLRPFKRSFFLRRDGLWKRELDGSEELIGPGIGSFFVLYDLKERFVEAGDIEAANAWEQVKGVRLQLAAQGAEEQTTAGHGAYFSLRNRRP